MKMVPSKVSLFNSAFSLLFMLATSIVSTLAFASAPVLSPIVVDPLYSRPLLSPASQAATAWTNVIPNALADYYTYVPYSTSDANALGFPMGVCGSGPSQQDCYTITVREVQQQLALPTIFVPTVPGTGQGLLNRVGTPFATNGVGTLTRGYGYGSGGDSWTPPFFGAPSVSRGNAPIAFPGGIWHFPAPTIKSTSNRPVRIQWLNELPPNVPPVGLDPTIDCGVTAPYCYPYNRMVTHVHGAHVNPESDGFANAWFTRDFAITGPDFIDTSSSPFSHGPKNTGYYPNDQQAATIWYHDHAMGTTHQNTQMGLAGFWPITDDNEKCLQGVIAAGTGSCPQGQLKVLPYDPTSKYELGFALQDRTFYTDGQIAMPDSPVYDLNTGLPGGSPPIAFDPVTNTPIPCTLLANGIADPSTCKRLDWMYDGSTGTHLVPYNEADTVALSRPENVNAPFGAPSTTLEYFGNMPMVNGVTYGKYNIEPTVYRMRFIGGADSRTWIMSLNTAIDGTGTNIPFYQIASEQGFLEAPVQRTSMLLMPGERLDVLVDFTGHPSTRIYMNNLGPDVPYNGNSVLLDPGQARSTDIPVIMAFDVSPDTVPSATPSVAVPPAAIATTGTPLRPVSGAIATLVQTLETRVRKISLMEITDQYGRTLPTIDSRGFMPMGVPITETMLLSDTETWDIINTTMDAHPMHLHLVQFQVIGRTPFDNTSVPPAATAFVPPVTNPLTGIYREPSYTATGAMVPPDAWDAGWKDTVYAPPGFVTTVRAKFDVLGTYVWHCHILSHEEHDMMRPQAVVNPYTTVTLGPSAISQSTSAGPITLTASSLGGGTGTTTTSVTTAPEYRFSTSPHGLNSWTVVNDYTTSAVFHWPVSSLVAGIYDVKVDVRHVGGSHDSEVTSNTVNLTLTPVIPTAPTALSPTLSGIITTPPFTFSAVPGATGYQIYLQDFTTATGGPTNITPTQAGCATGTGTCSFTMAAPLVVGHSYGWAIAAQTAAGQGPWSNPLNFIVGLPPAPFATAPNSAITTTAPAFTFSAVSGATGYQIYLYNFTTTIGGSTNITPTQAGCAAGTGTCSFTMAAPLVAGDAYGWVVAAQSTAGQGPWSNPLSFGILPPASTAIYPLGGNIIATPPFTFNAVPGATGYMIYLYNFTTGTGGPTNITAAQAGCATGTGTCSFTWPTTLISTDNYGWAVSVQSAAGPGPWSNPLSFIVQ